MPIEVQAELKRKPTGSDTLVSWELVADAENPDSSRADPVKDFGVRDRLDTTNERFAGGLTPATATVTAAGDTTLVAAPGVGMAIKLYWVTAINDPDAATNPLIIIKADGGTEYYRTFAIAHWEPFTLPDDTALVMNLSDAASVAVTVHYKIV